MSVTADQVPHHTGPGPRGARRILMLAYACSPYRGSEPGVGWQRAAEMSKYFDVWVITEEHEFRDDIERYVRENGSAINLHFHFVPRLIASEEMWRWLGYVRPLYYLAYRFWHRRAYRAAIELCDDVGFELTHQSTMCGFREPGRLWRLDVPFIWGPVGGTQNYPWRFLPQAGLTAALKEGTRSILNLLQLRFSHRVRQASKRAAAMLTALPAGQQSFRRFHGVDAICMLDVGVKHVVDTPRSYQGKQPTFRLLWSGSLEHRKALQLLLRALASLPDDLEYELRILGRGPKEKSWRRLASRLGVSSRCTWLGWLPHEEALRQMDWADVFVFTSLRDTCGTVVLEALSHGLPVICLDHQGVGSVITDNCGIKVPVTTPGEVVTGLSDAIVEAAFDDEKMEALSRGAIERAREYLWTVHGERLAALYNDVHLRRSISADSQPAKTPVRQSEEPRH